MFGGEQATGSLDAPRGATHPQRKLVEPPGWMYGAIMGCGAALGWGVALYFSVADWLERAELMFGGAFVALLIAEPGPYLIPRAQRRAARGGAHNE